MDNNSNRPVNPRDYEFTPAALDESEHGTRSRSIDEYGFQAQVRKKEPLSSGVDVYGNEYSVFRWPKFAECPRASRLAMIAHPRDNCILYEKGRYIVEIYTNATGPDQPLDDHDHFAFSSAIFDHTGMRFYLCDFPNNQDLDRTPEYIADFLLKNGNFNIMAVKPPGCSERVILKRRKCLFMECTSAGCFEFNDKTSIGNSHYLRSRDGTLGKSLGACSMCHCRHYHCGNIDQFRVVKNFRRDPEEKKMQSILLSVPRVMMKKTVERKSARSTLLS